MLRFRDDRETGTQRPGDMETQTSDMETWRLVRHTSLLHRIYSFRNQRRVHSTPTLMTSYNTSDGQCNGPIDSSGPQSRRDLDSAIQNLGSGLGWDVSSVVVMQYGAKTLAAGV